VAGLHRPQARATAFSRFRDCGLKIGTDRLHHGPLLVVTEAAALQEGAEVLGTDELRIDSLTTTIVARAASARSSRLPWPPGQVVKWRRAAWNFATPDATTVSWPRPCCR
jgi:hypothetical protein